MRATATKTLSDGQQVRTTMDVYRPVITVHSIEAFFANMSGFDVAEEYDKAKAKGEATAWTNQSGSCLTSDYAGKAADHAAKMARYGASILIEDGEEVIIEGRLYTVKYMGINYSDPVHFIEVED